MVGRIQSLACLDPAPFRFDYPEYLVRGSAVFPLLGVLICLMELIYPLLIWPKRTRVVCLSGICLMHLMIGLTMGMHSFAAVMIVLNLAAFAPNLSVRFDRIMALWPAKISPAPLQKE